MGKLSGRIKSPTSTARYVAPSGIISLLIRLSDIQPVPIPSYLIAIASGNLCYRAFENSEGKDWTSGVWAEPDLIDDAWWEFKEDTTRFFQNDRHLCNFTDCLA